MNLRFPKEFYRIEQDHPSLDYTSTPTGVLNTPLDLFNKASRPWVTIYQSSSLQKEPAQKTLIFADHLFAQRSLTEQDNVIRLLRRARANQFNILLLQDNGELKKWEGPAIPRDYQLDLREYTEEKIYHLAYQQHQLSIKQVFLIDYFGCNVLQSYRQNKIYWSHFRENNDLLLSLVATSSQPNYSLELEKPEDDLNQFLTFAEIAPNFPCDKFVSFVSPFNDDDDDDDEYVKLISRSLIERLFNYFPNIYELNFREDKYHNIYENLSGLFEKINPLHLQSLRFFFIDHSFSVLDIENILAAPDLEILIINKNPNNKTVFNNLKPGQLKNIKSIHFSYCQLDAKSIASLFNATPALCKFEMWGPINGTALNKTENITMHLLPLTHLRKFSIEGNCLLTPEHINTIFSAAPDVEIIDLPIKYRNEELNYNLLSQLKKPGFFNTNIKTLLTAPALEYFHLDHDNFEKLDHHLKEKQFPNLTSVELTSQELSPTTMRKFLMAAKNIKDIKINTDTDLFENLNITLANLNNMTLKNYSKIKATSFIDLLKCCPSLQKIEIYDYGHILSGIEHVPANEFSQLKNLQINNLNVLTTQSDLLALFTATPALETIIFYEAAANLAGLFQQINPRLLANVRHIDLSFSNITADDVRSIITHAPLLKVLTLNGCQQIAGCFEGLQLNQLKSLEEIKLIDAKVTTKDIEILALAAPSVDMKLKNENNEKNKDNNNASKITLPKGLDKSFFNTMLDKSVTLHFTRYFPNVDPSSYRLKVWQPNMDDFLFLAPPDFNHQDFVPSQLHIPSPQDPPFMCEKGTMQVKKMDGTKIVLPSLLAGEKLIDIRIIASNKKAVDLSQIKINYNHKIQFYSITLPKADDYTIYYTLALPVHLLKPIFPQNIQEKIDFYRGFGIAENNPDQAQFETMGDFADYLRKHKVGRCELRSLAAYHEIKKHLGNIVRIELNDLHAVISIQINGEWYSADLGGYPAKREELPMELITENDTCKIIQPVTKTSPPLFEMQETSLDKIIYSEGPALARVQNDIDLQFLYQTLAQHYAVHDIFVAHESQSLGLTGPGITSDGILISKNYTPFRRWLLNHSQGKGIICVDVRKFKSQELAQLNDLLDKTIEAQQLPSQLSILIIDDLTREQYGIDFRRRVSHKCKVTTPIYAKQLLSDMEPSDITKQDVIEIDLFHSVYWQRLLIGCWQLYKRANEDLFSFTWQRGKLLDALLAKQIVFKNPPLHDRSFTAFIAELISLRRIEWADQIIDVPKDINFYQTNGFDWQHLATQVTFKQLGEVNETLPVLSDATILSFIQDPAFRFSKVTLEMENQDCYLIQHQKQQTCIDVICSPLLSPGTLALFLTEAKKRNVPVRFLLPNSEKIPVRSPLHYLKCWTTQNENTQVEMKPVISLTNNRNPPLVRFYISDDAYFSAQELSSQHPHAHIFNFSFLDATELGYFPLVPDNIGAQFLATGKLAIHAKLSSFIKQHAGETTILYGKVPHHFYDTFISLSLGHVDGIPLAHNLIIIVTPEDSELVQMVTNDYQIVHPQDAEKKALLNKLYLDAKTDAVKAANFSFAKLEQDHVTMQLKAMYQPVPTSGPMRSSDQERADKFDEYRVQLILNALAINPWVMIEGQTGIGKTHFLHKILSQRADVVFDLDKWFESNGILAVDEANFMGQLTGQGVHFLARFVSLKGNRPCFLYKGEIHYLSKKNKAVFAFNPGDYGAGREMVGFLNEHALTVSFPRLPDYYLRANLVSPLLASTLPEYTHDFAFIADPLIDVYQWIVSKDEKGDLITPRELKMMVNLAASYIKSQRTIDQNALTTIANEVGYFIGKQTLIDSSKLLDEFEKHFKPHANILTRKIMPDTYRECQREAYAAIQNILAAREFLIQSFNENRYTGAPCNTDLGLGGILLEGGSSIGKTHFIKQIVEEHKQKFPQQKVYRISPNTPYHEKEIILRKAFRKRAIVLAEEFNTSTWPNKLLNSYLMGVDEYNVPASAPGFLFIVSQNPPSFSGRSEEDKAIRNRIFKMKLTWPVYEKPLILTNNIEKPLPNVSKNSYVNSNNFFSAGPASRTNTENVVNTLFSEETRENKSNYGN